MPYDSEAAVALSPLPAPVGDRRATFSQMLAERLRNHGIVLKSANLGSQGAHAVWMLAVQLRPRQVVMLSATLEGETPVEAYSDEACALVCERVVRWAQTNGG
jgi:hypothetical protein